MLPTEHSGEGEPYILLFTWYGDDLHTPNYERFVDERLTLLSEFRDGSWRPEPFFAWRPEPEGGAIRLYARSAHWTGGSEDALLRAIANDEIAHVLFINPRRGTLFAPYDGGADLIASSEAERLDLYKRLRDWLPGYSNEDNSTLIAAARLEERDTVRLFKAELGGSVYLDDEDRIVSVKLPLHAVTDDHLAHLGALEQLRTLLFYSQGRDLGENTQVTDAGLAALHTLRGVSDLRLEGFTGVSERGLEQLREALPGCDIWWSPDNSLR